MRVPLGLAVLSFALHASACEGQGSEDSSAQVEAAGAPQASGSEPASGSESEHRAALARLHQLESEARASTEFAALPGADGRFGADPYALLELPGERIAVLARGGDSLLLLDLEGQLLAAAATPHDPTDLTLRGDELLVVGTGEARLARYDAQTLAERPSIELSEALAPRALASDAERVWIADEGQGMLHELREDAQGELAVHASAPYCRGPLALARVDGWLVGNCLLEHRLRFDPVGEAGVELRDFDGPQHDGPIWSFSAGPRDAQGRRLLALTGVEDHPLERSDGGFGYIDSFLFVYALAETPADPAGPIDRVKAPVLTRETLLNTSALGVVTPKWSRWLPGEVPSLALAGYASDVMLVLRWHGEHAELPRIERRPALPGTRAAALLGDGRLLAANPLFDTLVYLGEEPYLRAPLPAHEGAQPDDRSFDERLGEALLFTTAMAPQNASEGKRSRFTCETCHFEGRGDGRVHFTGREFEGEPVHATSKPLLGLFQNRPHFSRAHDRDMITMVDNEFGVANRFSGRDPWTGLELAQLPWLAELQGWPEAGVDGEGLRRALARFLMRYSMTQNPAARGREAFTPLEAEGAELFAAQCESCHQARLLTDDPSTRVALGTAGSSGVDLEPWRALIFADNAPLVWASEAYVGTSIRPWVHAEGARVPSLRRLYMKAPYFTNGSAPSVEAVLAGIRLGAGPEGQADHTSEAASDADAGLDAHAREAIAAFVRLL